MPNPQSICKTRAAGAHWGPIAAISGGLTRASPASDGIVKVAPKRRRHCRALWRKLCLMVLESRKLENAANWRVVVVVSSKVLTTRSANRYTPTATGPRTNPRAARWNSGSRKPRLW